MTVASISVKLTANIAEFSKNMEKAASRTEMVGRRIAKVGREISQAISLPLIAAGFAAFHTLLGESARSFGPLFQAFDGLKAAVRGLFLALGVELQPVFLQIIAALRSGIATLRGWIDAFHELPEGVKKAVIYTLAFFAALGPTVFAVGKLITAVGGLIKIFPLLVSGTGLVVAGILAIAGAGIYTATHWDQVKELLLEDLGAIVQGFFLAAKAVVLTIDVMTLGLTELAGVSDMLRGKLDALQDKTLGKIGGLIFEANEKLAALTKGMQDLGGAGLSVEDIMKTLSDTLAVNTQRMELLGPRYNFAAANAAALEAAVNALTAAHVPLTAVLDAQGTTLGDLTQRLLATQEAAAQYARVIATFGPTSREAADAFKYWQEVLTQGKGFEVATQRLERYADALKATNAAIVDAATSGIAELGQQIGGILAGVNRGFKGLAGALAGILGNMLIIIGKAAIAAGIAGAAIKKFLHNPLAAVAAGVALVALGSALAATAQGAVNSAAGGGGGVGGGSSASVSSVSSQDQGSTDLVLRLESPDGLVDAVFRDPRNQEALARLIEELTDRNVFIEKTTDD